MTECALRRQILKSIPALYSKTMIISIKKKTFWSLGLWFVQKYFGVLRENSSFTDIPLIKLHPETDFFLKEDP